MATGRAAHAPGAIRDANGLRAREASGDAVKAVDHAACVAGLVLAIHAEKLC